MLAVLLTSLSLAGAAEPTCHGQLAPPSREEAAMAYYIDRRADLGFRADPEYVRELIERGVWEYDVGDIPVTPAENRYLRLRDRLELGRRATRYLHRHRDLLAGVEVADDWPREPYLLVRLTRDVRAHTRALRRLVRFPDNLRTVKAEHGKRELRRIQNRVSFDAHERDGFHVQGVGVDEVRGRVEIELITARTDHAEYFARHYGPLVVTKVIATELTRLDCTEADYFEVTSEGLVLHWTTGGGAEFAAVELVEHADRVEVGIVERVPNGARTLEARSAQQPVALSAPLGDRAVIDTSTGERLVQRGPSPGEPECPRPAELSRLDAHIRLRRSQGLPHGREHVRRTLRSNRLYTRREQRYVDLREELLSDDAVDRYVRRHDDEWGGTAIADRFPARPRLVVRFTRRTAFHEANLRRLASHPRLVRTERAERTVAELATLVARIEDDAAASGWMLDGYGDAAFTVTTVDRDEEAGTVVVELITRRTDHAAYFRARYGPLVRTRVGGDRFECRAGP